MADNFFKTTLALAVIFTPLVRHLHRRVEALMREITIHE